MAPIELREMKLRSISEWQSATPWLIINVRDRSNTADIIHLSLSDNFEIVNGESAFGLIQ